MNPHSSNQCRSGITLLEVMILMAVMAVLGFFLYQNLQRRPRALSKRITCVNQLKQIGLATRMWAMDHGDTYPAATAITNGGTMDHALMAQAWIHLQALSNELGTPKILVCPADRTMKPASVFGAGFGSGNVSYFVGVDAQETQPQMLLAGDRNLTTNGVRIGPGLHTVNTNQLLGWDKTMHNRCGNIGLADGSVQQLSEAALGDAVAYRFETDRLAIP